MNKQKARAIAAEYISEGHQTADGITPVIVDTETQEREFGWVFFYDSKEHVETGDLIYALAGNAPIVVLRDGRIRTTGTARPLSEYLKEIQVEENRKVSSKDPPLPDPAAGRAALRRAAQCAAVATWPAASWLRAPGARSSRQRRYMP